MAEPERGPDLLSRFRTAWERRPEGDAVLAVSGGSDSTALMHLVAETGDRPAVATVDHGLRPESADEAAEVAVAAAALGLDHVTLHWNGPDGGNLQGAAREGRYALIAGWADAHGANTIVTAHTLDDQAETVLMRLLRGSGIDGLAAMRERGESRGLELFRPLLGETRQALRTYLKARNAGWIEDPSNDDLRFDRIQVRTAMEALRLDPHRLARTADHMARAQDLLQTMADRWIAERDEGSMDAASFPREDFLKLHPESRLRVLAALLSRVSRQTYRPRFRALSGLNDALDAPEFRGSTLHGCRIRLRGDRILIDPEA